MCMCNSTDELTQLKSNVVALKSRSGNLGRGWSKGTSSVSRINSRALLCNRETILTKVGHILKIAKSRCFYHRNYSTMCIFFICNRWCIQFCQLKI